MGVRRKKKKEKEKSFFGRNAGRRALCDWGLTESTVEKNIGVLVHKSLKVASQCAAAAKKGNRALGMIKRSQRVVDKWNKLPQSAIDAPTLLSFKQELTNLRF